MGNPLWRFYRWFDSIEHLGFGADRFIIFITMILASFVVPTVAAAILGLDTFFGMMGGYCIMSVLGLTRAYWMRYRR